MREAGRGVADFATGEDKKGGRRLEELDAHGSESKAFREDSADSTGACRPKSAEECRYKESRMRVPLLTLVLCALAASVDAVKLGHLPTQLNPSKAMKKAIKVGVSPPSLVTFAFGHKHRHHARSTRSANLRLRIQRADKR